MGTDLILKKQGEQIADLGRAYNFVFGNKPINNFGELEDHEEYLHDNLLKNLLPYIGYTPKDKEELESIVSDVQDQIVKYAEECIKLGRVWVLLHLKDDGLEIERHF